MNLVLKKDWPSGLNFHCTHLSRTVHIKANKIYPVYTQLDNDMYDPRYTQVMIYEEDEWIMITLSYFRPANKADFHAEEFGEDFGKMVDE